MEQLCAGHKVASLMNINACRIYLGHGQHVTGSERDSKIALLDSALWVEQMIRGKKEDRQGGPSCLIALN